jgi:pyruvate carboxylase
MKDRDEISVDIDPGKTLVIRLQGSAPAEEEGQVKLFFELNGQPRTLRIEKLGAVRTTPQRARAEDGNRLHVPAPMPGMIVTVAAKVGQKVSAGGPLVSIEAMKMESQIRADRDGVIRAVHVRPGDVVAARDLLIEFEPDPTA